MKNRKRKSWCIIVKNGVLLKLKTVKLVTDPFVNYLEINRHFLNYTGKYEYENEYDDEYDLKK